MRGFVLVWVCFVMLGHPALGQDQHLRYSTYGIPGLIDMPMANSAMDAELAFSISSFAGQTRNTLSFQVSPRLSASLQYAALRDVLGAEDVFYDTILDRSLALHYRFLDETRLRPAMAVGVSDFVGTGIYAGEYVVATKSLPHSVSATFGLGWGRFAGVGGFDNPLGTAFSDRPTRDFGAGGQVSADALFRGDAAFFGGLRWTPSARLDLAAEYSSDAYIYQDGVAFERGTPWNVGLTYALRPHLRLSAQYLYGAELGAQVTYVINPLDPPFGTGFGVPIVPTAASSDLAAVLAAEGLVLRGFRGDDARAHVVIENLTFNPSAQAIGRATRVLAGQLPVGVQTFHISLAQNGLVGPAVVIDRAAWRENEFASNGGAMFRKTAQFALPVSAVPMRPRSSFSWGVSPYLTPNLFDPDDPLRADVGLALDTRWHLRPNLIVAGTLRQKLAGNLDQATRMSRSVLPRVRSDFALYDQEGDADIADLTVGWYGQPSSTVTTRLTFGLLEPMFAGASAEILWRPANVPWALGAEVNQLRQRDYDGGFELRDYQVTSGHASLYWEGDAGYGAQLDMGRYLAGDWGGTLTVSRHFANGWKLGVFATLTDVPFDEFGEGSFDKGIIVSVPLSWISGQPRRDTFDRTIRPVTRDGGARVAVEGRLYQVTRPQTAQVIDDTWGMFWR